ncbi:MAG: hypothetical protein ACJAQ3_004431, partial [Planctomycetota bacterium]
ELEFIGIPKGGGACLAGMRQAVSLGYRAKRHRAPDSLVES